MKSLSCLLLFTVFSLHAVAGPHVSEGPGPLGEILNCQSRASRSTFAIRRTAAITFIQGLYLQDNADPVNMGCKKNDSEWSCSEIGQSGGENKLFVKAYRNSQGIATAQVFRQNQIGESVLVDSLFCRSGE